MAKGYSITCLDPFQVEKSPYTITEKDVAALFASLAHDIQKLQKSLSANSLTLEWCTEAMILLKNMHADFLLLIQSLKVPMISWNGISKLLDEYMNESLNILELCNLLKSAVNEMNRNLIKIDIAARNKSEGKSLEDIQILDVQATKFYGSLRWKNEDSIEVRMHMSKTKNCTTNTLCAIRGAITIISSILFGVIVYPIPVEIKKEIYCELPQIKLFVDSTQELVKCFNNKSNIPVGNIFVAFLGNEISERAITDTKSDPKKLSVIDREASTQQKSAALKVGLEVFELEVTKVFEEVLRGRNKLLQQITPTSKNID